MSSSRTPKTKKDASPAELIAEDTTEPRATRSASKKNAAESTTANIDSTSSHTQTRTRARATAERDGASPPTKSPSSPTNNNTNNTSSRSKGKGKPKVISSPPSLDQSDQPEQAEEPVALGKRKRRSAEQQLIEEAAAAKVETTSSTSPTSGRPRKAARMPSGSKEKDTSNGETGDSASPPLQPTPTSASKRSNKSSRSRSRGGTKSSPALLPISGTAPTPMDEDEAGSLGAPLDDRVVSRPPSRSKGSSRRSSRSRQADPEGDAAVEMEEQPQSPSLGRRRNKKQDAPPETPSKDKEKDSGTSNDAMDADSGSAAAEKGRGSGNSTGRSSRKASKEASESKSSNSKDSKPPTAPEVAAAASSSSSSSSSSSGAGAGAGAGPSNPPPTTTTSGASGNPASLAAFFGLTGGPFSRNVPGAGNSSATSGRFSSLLAQLRSKDDPTAQMIALQELSEILSVATEDMFTGRGGYGGGSSSMVGFDVEAWVRELLNVVKGPEKKDPREALRAAGIADDFPLEFLDTDTLAELGISDGGGGNAVTPDLMLLALRCLSNLIEALPSTTAIIMHTGGVPVLVSKMKEIEYIDLAESVLSVLQKVASEYPLPVLRADGLNAVLGYIDFFALSTQRVAVNIAADALRGLGSVTGADDMVRSAMPTFERLMGYGDARLVEAAVKAIQRTVDWATRAYPSGMSETGTVEAKVESLISPSVISTILQLLNTNSSASSSVVTPQLYTSLLRLLPPILRSSSKYAHSMVAEWGLADLVKGVLAGGEMVDVTEMDGIEEVEDVAGRGLAERVMKMISTRTEDQIVEALTVASDAIVGLPKDDMWSLKVKMLSQSQPAAAASSTVLPVVDKAESPVLKEEPADIDMDAAEGSGSAENAAVEAKSKDVAESQEHAEDGGDGEGEDDGDGDEGEDDEGEGDGEGEDEDGEDEGEDDGMDDQEDEDHDEEMDYSAPSPVNVSAAVLQRNSKLSDLHREDKKHLVEFCATLLPVILEVHAATVQSQIRRRCSGLVARLLWFCSEIAGQDGLRQVLERAKGFGSFVTSLIVQGRDGTFAPTSAAGGSAENATGMTPSASAVVAAAEANRRSEQLAVLSAGLQLALLVLERCPEPYLRAFVREGVLHEVEKTAQVATAWLEAQQPAGPATEATAAKDATGDSVMADAANVTSPSSLRRSSRRQSKVGSSGESGPLRQDSAGPARRASTVKEPTSTASLLSGMRRMLAKLTDVVGSSTADLASASVARSETSPVTPPSGGAANQSSRSPTPTVTSLSGDRFADKDAREWVVWMCSRILAFYSENAVDRGNDDVGRVLREMKNLAKTLSDSAKRTGPVIDFGQDPADIESLHRVAQLLAGVGVGEDGKGATSFEILQSGIVEGFADYLCAIPTNGSHKASQDVARLQHLRVKAFVHVFMNGPWVYPAEKGASDGTIPNMYVPNAMRSLTRRLQSLLSRTEQFDVVAAVPGQASTAALAGYHLEGFAGSLLASMQNPALQLTKQLRLKLVAEEPDNVPRTFANYMVQIHAVATFKAVEEFLKQRLGSIDFGAPPTASSASAAGGAAPVTPPTTRPESNVASSSGKAGEPEVESKSKVQEDVEMGDGDEEDLVDEGEEGDDDEHNEDVDEGGEEGEDDYDYDGHDEDMVDVSDLLLHSEEESRRRRSKAKRVDSSGSSLSTPAPTSAPQTDGQSQLERQRTGDSFVVDIGDKEDMGPLTPNRTLRSRPTQNAGGASSSSATPAAAPKNAVTAASSGLPPPSPSSSSSKPAAPSTSTSSAQALPTPGGSSNGGALSYSSVVAGTANAYHIEFSVGEAISGVYIPVTSDMTVFSACWKLEQELAKRRSATPSTSVNVWNSSYTVKFRKVAGPRPTTTPSQSSSSSSSKSVTIKDAVPPSPSTSASVQPVDHLLIPDLPFETTANQAIDQSTAAGRILYLLRALHGINTNWADVYLDENAKVMEMSHAKELFDSQPLDEEAMVVEGEQLAKNRVEPVPARTDLESHPGVIASLPASAFVNSKVTAKLARQLDEPLIVAGRVVPEWCAAVARSFNFLVSFESRWTFLQSTSFGYSRSMLRWQQQQQQQGAGASAVTREQQVLGRIQRQKVRISRNRVLESMIKVMELYGSSQALLEVEFFEEVGTGLGPTLEFYTLVCTEIQKAKLRMWRDESSEVSTPKSKKSKSQSGESDRYVLAPHGLFPSPMSASLAASENGKRLLNLFRNLGTFVAKSLLDARLIDIPFNAVFLRQILKGCFTMAADAEGEGVVDTEQQRVRGLHYLKHIDPALTQSLLHLQKYVHHKRTIESRADLSADERLDQLNSVKVDGATVEDLCLDFSLPGYPDFELLPNGKNVGVTIFNIEDYIGAVIEATLGDGVRRQVEAFKTGFDIVFPVSDLSAFTLEELGMLLGGGQQEDWSVEALVDAVKADHGFRMDSVAMRNLVDIMSEFTTMERREFLQFVTGSPKLPLGGFKNLSPALTVVCKTTEPPHQPDDYLPSVMTCVNYLKMPDYSTKAVMKAKLLLAMSEGKGAFHLS